MIMKHMHLSVLALTSCVMETLNLYVEEVGDIDFKLN